MKFGFRTPNLEKRLKAKTTGVLKRKAKSAINPLYGKKGMGIVNNPKKALYNKIYNKTTIDPLKLGKFSHENDIEFEGHEHFELDKKTVMEYVHQDIFKKLIAEELPEHSKIFILNQTVNKIMSGKLVSDEEIEECIKTSSKNISTNRKILPIILKISLVVLLSTIVYLIIFK
ncbi:hypothetical protein IX329_000312 [Fusobacterium necrophorum]|nr:hypothetical protein [Fusobacterium necrophorum]MBR8732741.1 hypothetical protein [Fusobacterium necrophorum]MBR8788918.1 hypothetical protein [Fusobacterium necrophorum]